MDVNDDLIADFLIECHENLDRLDRDLVALEKAPQDRETQGSIFRTLHTIKGTCGFFGFATLQKVAHAGETLLSRLRDRQLRLNEAITSALLALVDAIREILACIEQTGREGVGDYSVLLETFRSLLEGPSAERSEAPTPETLDQPTASVPQEQDMPAASVLDGSIRVDVGLLDKLMNLVGELVLARNQILQCTTVQKDSQFLGTSQRLNLITTELQEGVMKTRMQPIGNVWNKFPRLVRDLAVSCAKQVRLEMEGPETELDKTIIEAIKDPLTHLVRNAVDHGIEPPDVRRRRGKPLEGRLFLRAFHEGGQVNIEIDDDGAGIDVARVKQKALEREFISREQAAHLSERELLRLIFLPGFSTAGQITDVSGRGVGMDVVRTNIEKIGGVVDVQSRPGQGTTVKIKIPLTLAIIPALIVTCAGDRYAIPQVSLVELVRLNGDQARHGIEHLHGTPVYRLRGNLLPLVDLNGELRVESRPPGADQDAINIAVLQADGRPFGLVVERIIDTAEIVVKPLAKRLKEIPQFAGATIMEDGKVALILDVMGLAQSAGVVSEVRNRTRASTTDAASERREDRQTLLLCRFGQDRRAAIPLTAVDRLEEIPCSSVERAGDQEVVQYRGRIIPLVHLGSLFEDGETDAATDGPLQVVVSSAQGQSVGLIVERICDIVDTTLELQPSPPRDGIQGAAVIQGRVTDLLDIPAIIRRAAATAWDRGQPVTAEN